MGHLSFSLLSSKIGGISQRSLEWAAATSDVNAIQKCHRLGKAEVSPEALRVARLSSPETSYIVGLVSLAKVSGKAGVFLFW